MIEQALLVLFMRICSFVDTSDDLLLLKQRASRTKALHGLLVVDLLKDGAVFFHSSRVIKHMLHLLQVLLLTAEWN